MTFALAGNLITQTGIDDDTSTLNGLSAIAGVSAMGQGNHTRLIIPYRFNVTGALSNTALTAFTFSRAGIPANEVVVTGRWNYKQAFTLNGLTDWRIMPPMIFTQTPLGGTGYNGNDKNLIYVNGGTIDFAKMEIIGSGGQYWNGGNIILRDMLINAQGAAGLVDNQVTTQSGNPTIDIDGLEIRGASLFMRDYVLVNLNRVKAKFVSRGFGTGFGLSKALQDFDPSGAEFDVSIYAGGYNPGGSIRLNNAVKGSAIKCGPWNAPSNASNEIYCTADLVLTAVNEVGAAVLFKAYHRDNNTGAPVGAGITATNYTLRKTYNVASSVAGVASLNILLGASLNDNAMVARAAVQTGDLYTFNCFSYLSVPTITTPISLAGAGAKSATVVQLKDPAITQLVKATVDAYATIDTLDQLYDRAKSFLFDNFAGETAPLFLTNGTSLDAGSRNIIVDAAAATAFSWNAGTNTITIKSSVLASGSKFLSFKTTGLVTVSGATITAPYTDSTGNSYLRFESIDAWTVYSNAARTNQIGTGAGSQQFKFNYVAATTYYLTLVIGSESLQKAVSPAGLGETIVSLSQTALLNKIALDATANRNKIIGTILLAT